jgi:sugar lactone lactonase YvrE
MTCIARLLLALMLLGSLATAPARAQQVVTLASNLLFQPYDVALDASGNAFVSDTGGSSVKEYLAATGYKISVLLASANGNFNAPAGLAVDGAGNVFVADAGNNAVKEIVAAGGYVEVRTLVPTTGGFSSPLALALDGSGNLFVADTGHGQIKEIPAAGGYATVETIADDLLFVFGIAVDAAGDVFFTQAGDSLQQAQGSLEELPAADNYLKMVTLAPTFIAPLGMGIDRNGDLFVCEFGDPLYSAASDIKEVLASGGYTTVQTVPASTGIAKSQGIQGVAVDSAGNLFVASVQAVDEIPAAGGYTSVTAIDATDFHNPEAAAVDAAGDVFFVEPSGNAVLEIPAAGGYQTVVTLPVPSGSFNVPAAVALDGAGNLFVADSGNNAVKEVPAAGGYTTVQTLGAGAADLSSPSGITVDSGGNVFVVDTGHGVVKEILAAGGYTNVQTLAGSGGWFGSLLGAAVDGSGNLFITGFPGTYPVVEVPPAGGYAKGTPLGIPPDTLNGPNAIAVDGSGNLFITDSGINAVWQIPAAGGYTSAAELAQGMFEQPTGVAVGAGGNVFVADTGHSAMKEIVLAPSPVAAAILPGARSVEAGNPATVFATMVNGGTSGLTACAPHLPGTAPGALSLDFQTTNPATNTLTGTKNQPVPIAAGASQSFVLGFSASTEVTAPGLPIVFLCDGAGAVGTIPGVNTVDLLFASTPVPDIIVQAATASPGLTLHLANGAGAFAIATDDNGTGGTLTAVTDTGGATLPLSLTLCQTNAAAQCQAAPASSLPVAFTPGATPTFSVFASSTGAIPFAPATARIFVRFLDPSGTSHGTTSVAVTTD